MTRVVLFDLYETLVTERERILAPTPANVERLDIDSKTFGAEFRARREKRFTGGFPDYASVLTDICVAMDVPVDPALIGRIEERRLAEYAQVLRQAEPEVLNMLREIRLMGLKTGLVSNVSPEEMTGWEGSPLSGLMDAVVFSCRAGVMKPDPEIYRIACNELGAEPQDCIYVGDGGSDELPAASAIGMAPYCAMWFIDRYPEQIRRDHNLRWNVDFPKLRTPAELTAAVSAQLSG